jgi:hypothetical protein
MRLYCLLADKLLENCRFYNCKLADPHKLADPQKKHVEVVEGLSERISRHPPPASY